MRSLEPARETEPWLIPQRAVPQSDCKELSLGKPSPLKGGQRDGEQLLQRTEMLHCMGPHIS